MSGPRVVASDLGFPEGPLLLADGDLLVADVRHGRVHRVSPAGGEVTTEATPGGGPNGLALGADGAVYVANSGGWEYRDLGSLTLPLPRLGPRYSGGRIERIDLASGAVTVLYDTCEGVPLTSPNDLVVDEAGGIWCTDHGRVTADGRHRILGGVYYAAPDGSSIRRVIHPVDSANGIGLAPDGRTLYVADTDSGRLLAWALAGPGVLADPEPFYGAGGRVVADPGGGRYFDSLAVRTDGTVVVAAPGRGTVCAFTPAGELALEVETGDLLTTNVCFSADERTAYVTASGQGALLALDWPA